MRVTGRAGKSLLKLLFRGMGPGTSKLFIMRVYIVPIVSSHWLDVE